MSKGKATGSNSAYFIKYAVSPFLEKKKNRDFDKLATV